MLTNDCLPNSWTYNVLIQGLCKEDKVQEALMLIGKMIKIGLELDIATYTIFIERVLKSFDFFEARKLFGQLGASGLKPDVCTYTSFILAYCTQGMIKEAEDMMNEMMEKGVQPDTATYTVFIDAYCHAGQINCGFDVLKRIVWKIMEFDDAIELFSEMVKRGCEPKVNTFDALTVGLCKERRIEEALKLVNHMLTNGIPPNERKHEKGKEVFCGLLDGYNSDEVAWTILLDGLLKHGLVKRYFELVDVMEKKGCHLNRHTYQMLVDKMGV
ncbi:hypothetical protein L2E82_06120 [Cichorium intybus]|uniref:Uncharacterized protein n=1 Tax=Cichorium intybus TaxID=13427 RepID=A0ACB9H9Q6_CICIN|nr:hypothetical protein L2E82_06120 [Cichorium intybus]